MFFDQFVNKILKENIISSVPSFQKEEEKPKVVPKKIADIGATQPLQQGVVPQGQQPTTPQQNQEDPNSAVDELSKQIADAKKADEERAKKEHDDFAKLIATLTAATQQQQQQTTAPQSTSTNPQDVIANLQKLG
jgi:hypothetical protein